MTGSAEWASRGTVTVIGKQCHGAGAAKFFSGKGAAVNIAGPSDNAAAMIAGAIGVRHVQWNAVHDVKNRCSGICRQRHDVWSGKGQVNPMMIRERMIVVDLTVALRVVLPSRMKPEVAVLVTSIRSPYLPFS